MSVEFRMIETNGVRLRAAVEGEGPLVLMVHGFPESWYSWRHQMGPLAAAGFMACAIDVRGYGGSDKPHAIEAYDMETIAADVAGVIDALSPGKPAVLIGHDWGAPIVWHTALLHPDKVRAVAALSVPYRGLPPAPPIDIWRRLYTDQGRFFYQVYFQDEGVAEAELEADVRASIRKLYFAASGATRGGWFPPEKKHGERLLDGLTDPDPFPDWLSEADIDYYVREFEQSGFRGPLNRYRNFERDYAFMRKRADHTISQPALFIVGEHDLVLRFIPGHDLVSGMQTVVPNLRAVFVLPGVGHWTQQEAPDAVTGHLIDWLATL